MNNSEMHIQFTLPIKTELSEQELNKKARESLLCNLYVEDKVSEKEICTVLAITRRQFQQLLEKYHTPRLHTEEDAQDEINFSS